MGINLNAAKKLSIVKIGTSRCSHFGNFLMFLYISLHEVHLHEEIGPP